MSDPEQHRLQKEYWSDDQSGRRPPDHPVVAALFVPRARFIASLVPKTLHKSVLDVGCGNGFLTIPLQRYFERVVGVDWSATMLASNPSEERVRGSVLELPFQESSFDVVVASHLLHHLVEAERLTAIEELSRVACRAVVLYEPNRNNPLMFTFGLLKKEERMSLKFSKNYVRSLLRESSMPHQSVRVEGLIVPNKAPEAWIPISEFLNRTPLRGAGFYICAVASPHVEGDEGTANDLV